MLKPKLEDRETLAYIAGVYLTDGYVVHKKSRNYEVGLLATDEPFVRSFGEALSKIGLSVYYTTSEVPNRKLRYTAAGTSVVLAKWLKDIEKDPMTLRKTIESHEWAFLRGAYEGDGGLIRSRARRKHLGLAITKGYPEWLIPFIAGLMAREGFHPWLSDQRMRSGKIIHKVSLTRHVEVLSFLEHAKPVIKRPEYYANLEPSRLNGQQVGRKVQRLGVEESKPIRPHQRRTPRTGEEIVRAHGKSWDNMHDSPRPQIGPETQRLRA